MKHIFNADFSNLLREYREPMTREDKLIKHKLDSIVALYDNCSVEEREFADEITFDFSRIIVLLKNQHRQEMMELSQKYQELENRQENLLSTYIPLHRKDQGNTYKFDHEVLSAFYDYFKRPGDDQLSYRQIERYQFENEEQRRDLVNLTMWDYCNRIKTFAKKYLYEIYPDDSIPRAIHGAEAMDCVPSEPIVFVYNNLELILAKMKTTNENGETIKQRLNIRSALRKLNEFKQESETEKFLMSHTAPPNPLDSNCIFESDQSIQKAYVYYLQHFYKKEKLTEKELFNACPRLSALWSVFYRAYKNGELSQHLSGNIDEDEISEEKIVNLYNYIEMVHLYCDLRKAASSNEIWLDFTKEVSRFLDFVIYVKNNRRI